jgi:hypothetical protein
MIKRFLNSSKAKYLLAVIAAAIIVLILGYVEIHKRTFIYGLERGQCKKSL